MSKQKNPPTTTIYGRGNFFKQGVFDTPLAIILPLLSGGIAPGRS